jgi:predicted nucleotidyltransferase
MAAQLSPSQLKIYRKTAHKREAEFRLQLEARRQRAWVIARQAATILKEKFGASRVVVFGSLLYPERYHLGSDIDLAAWDVRDYFRAVSCLLDIDPAFEFDLVPVEDARPGILDAIRKEGIDL